MSIKNIVAALALAVSSATIDIATQAAPAAPIATATESWVVIVEGPKGTAIVRFGTREQALKAAVGYVRAGLTVVGIVRGSVI